MKPLIAALAATALAFASGAEPKVPRAQIAASLQSRQGLTDAILFQNCARE